MHLIPERAFIEDVTDALNSRDPRDLAEHLLRTRTKAERRKILNTAGVDPLQIANSLKDHCYEKWTSEPTIARSAAAAMADVCQLTDDRSVEAISDWVNGIANITRGKLETAVDDLERAAEGFKISNDPLSSAQPMVAKLIALAMLGKYPEAEEAGRRALKVFVSLGDELAAGKVELNLSNIAARRERHSAAKKLAESALRRFERIGETTWQTMAENDIANTYADLCELELAEHFYRKASEGAAKAGMTVTRAEIEASIGDLARASGRYGEALRRLETSRETYERLAMPHQTAIAHLEIADIYAELNLHNEASEAYERLIRELRKLKLRSEEGRARTNYGLVLLRNGNSGAAQRQLNAALRVYEKEENAPARAMVLLHLGFIALASGDTVRSENHVRSAIELLSSEVSPRRELYARLLLAKIAYEKGDKKHAQTALEALLKRSRKIADPRVTIAALTLLASIAEGSDIAIAEKLYLEAIENIELLRQPLPGEEFRRAYLRDKLEPIERLVTLYVANGRFEDALLTLERGRARSLYEIVADGTRLAKPDSDGEAATVKLREKLNFLYTRGERQAEDASRTAARSSKLERRLADIRRRETSKARKEIHERGWFSSKDLAAFRQMLGKDRAFIEYFREAESYSAFIITDKEFSYVPSLISIDQAQDLYNDLHFGFSGVRVSLSAGKQFAALLRKKTEAVLGRAYRALVEPTEELTRDRDLIISPSGLLNFLPFAAFFDGSDYLIRRREVVYAPSAAISHTLGSRRIRSTEPSVLAGYADDRIPLVEAEIEAVREFTAGKVETLLGERASFENFVKAAPSAGLLHIACHGVYRPDNPMFSSLHFAEGWVTANDMLDLKLKAELVTLSACETGVSTVDPGEETVGLARGFLSAGASNVLLSLWTVSDRAAQELMTDFYRNMQRGRSPAASLRSAQIKLAERDEHPYLWAPFVLVGR